MWISPAIFSLKLFSANISHWRIRRSNLPARLHGRIAAWKLPNNSGYWTGRKKEEQVSSERTLCCDSSILHRAGRSLGSSLRVIRLKALGMLSILEDAGKLGKEAEKAEKKPRSNGEEAEQRLYYCLFSERFSPNNTSILPMQNKRPNSVWLKLWAFRNCPICSSSVRKITQCRIRSSAAIHTKTAALWESVLPKEGPSGQWSSDYLYRFTFFTEL